MKTLIAAMTFCLFSFHAQAAKITVVKNGKALIDLEGDSVAVGDQFMALNEQGKRKALLTVKQVKGNKAVATIDKGKPSEGFALEAYEGHAGGAHRSKDKAAGGLSVGYAMNNMTVKPANGSVSLTGTSFNLLGFYQMQLDKNISVKFLGGYQTLVAKGTADSAICNGTTDCSVDLSYLGVNALIRYSFHKSKTWDIWGGGGLGFLFAIGKSSNVLDTSKVTTNQTIIGSLGADYSLSKDNFIPFQFDYAMFPNNSTSSANQMIFSAGYGWAF
ncbi:hypothetical protein [Bdellovibrio svalbardensis]|uniref:Outer membrane protein beta-barrel domain-containing protein n=1 Tax=Bdellovibrio svalbardensis TaxID=2972972 RepID=A0ABT6DGX5_9BACT|nr:hypothetical protein [Bdellovibrio svalbardensis]MDG0816057.1 hypothetical protein [Bdellovibrio svalbardensis]